MQRAYNRHLSDIEYERNQDSTHPAAMVPTTPPEEIAPTVHRTAAQKAHRRYLQFQLRLQRATAPGAVDSLTAWKARFADYLLRPREAATASAPVTDTDLMRAAIYGAPGDYERLLNT